MASEFLNIIINKLNAAKEYNKKIKLCKRKTRAFDKITKICNKYGLFMSKTDDFKLIISGFMKFN